MKNTKKCTACGLEKSQDDFEPRRRKCKTCRVEERKARRLEKAVIKAPESVTESAQDEQVGTVELVSEGPSTGNLRDSTSMSTEDRLKGDFRVFAYVIWKRLNLPKPTDIQYDICHFLQNGPRNIAIQAFRGVGKSFLTAAFVLWLLWKDPQLKILIVSANKARADSFSTFLMQLINDVPILRHLRPRHDQRQSKIEFDVGPATPDQSPSVKSAGITGQITGSRADIIIADDVEVPGNSATADMREKLQERIKEFSAIIKPLPTTRIIYLGTPQTEDSIYNNLSREVFTTRIWPARIPSEKTAEAYNGDLAPIIVEMMKTLPEGSPVDPVRFDSEDLRIREADYGKAGFALQFMLSTRLTDEERFPLKVKDLVIMDTQIDKAPINVNWLPDPKFIVKGLPELAMAGDRMFHFAGASSEQKPYEEKIMAIDPSGRGADETGYAVIGMLSGFIHVRKCGGFQGGYDTETLTKLIQIAMKEKVQKIIIEPNFGAGMFTELLKGVAQGTYSVDIEETPYSQTQKERRIIDVIEPVMARHRLVVDPQVIEDDWQSVQKYEPERRVSKTLIHQMTRICYEKGALKHDDRLDALALAIAYFVDRMDRNVEQEVVREQQKRRDAEIDKLMRHVGQLKGKSRGKHWKRSRNRR
ncbi:hypothetical protein GCM10007148_24450 [Parvularcula lutaonensis]|nr:hypothetical protein GCM10007148_24450 [Parvularcula lutaonensis]